MHLHAHLNGSTAVDEAESEGEYMFSTKKLLRIHSSSVEWTRLSQQERSKLGLKLEQAAEFW